jgi:transcriptional regulator with AAA-type ATPase domain
MELETLTDSLVSAPDGDVRVLPRLGIRWVFPDRTGRFSPASEAELVVGRDPGCGIVLPGHEISRQHARVWQHGDRVAFRDLGSRNGVSLNGRSCAEGEAGPGDLLRMGEWVGVVTLGGPEGGIGESYTTIPPGVFCGPALWPSVAMALRVATSPLPVVLVGATGTGKEVLARLIHHASKRTGEFVAINCAALPESLAEAELFGYRRGAFTGADRAHGGYFRQADGGTLLLDEIAELPPGIQAKLLRVVEEGKVTSLGDAAPAKVDVRLIVACQQPLDSIVALGRFRSDLRARLEGLVIRIPPLAARREDIAFLFLSMLEQRASGRPPRVSPRLVETICLQDYPHNVREMGMLVQRLLALHGSEKLLRRRHLAGLLPSSPSGSQSPNSQPAVESALRRHRGNVAHAAAELGMSRQALYRLAKGLDLRALRGKGCW